MWISRILFTATISVAILGFAQTVAAHDHQNYQRDSDRDRRNSFQDDEHRFSVYGGLGIGVSPGSFAFGTGIEFHILHELSVGPMLQVLASDNDAVVVAATANVRYHFDLSDHEIPFVSRLEPFLQGGLGVVHADLDQPDRDDTEFLMNAGFGIDFRVNERLAIGSSLMFNGVPGEGVLGDDFFASWQLLGARYHF